jgi:hypothetical protein
MAASQAHAALASELLHFTTAVESFDSPEAVLNALHYVTMPACKMAVLGALLLPLRWEDLSAIELGKTVFLHKSAPKGWWDEQFMHMQRGPRPGRDAGSNRARALHDVGNDATIGAVGNRSLAV